MDEVEFCAIVSEISVRPRLQQSSLKQMRE